MNVIIAIAILFASSGFAFAPHIAEQSEFEKIETTVWSVMQDKTLTDVYMAILWHESRYNQQAINYNTDGSYDFGVAQLNSRYWNPDQKYYGADIRTVRGNVFAGARFFLSLAERFPFDVRNAILAYNCGAGAVLNGRVPECSKKYASRVLQMAAFRRI